MDFYKSQRGVYAPLAAAAVIVAVAVYLFGKGFFVEKATVLFIAEGNRFVQQNEAFTVLAAAESRTPFNTVAMRVRYPKDIIGVVSVSTEGSALELWVQDPLVDHEEGTIEFGGGVITPRAGRVTIAKITFAPKRTGEAVIEYEQASVLAADGRGTEILGTQRDIAYNIRAEKLPSADLNDDNTVTIRDVSSVLARVGSSDTSYDLNFDGKVDLTDVSIVIAKLFK